MRLCLEISQQKKGKKEFTDRLASLPYVFRDLTQVNKKSDPKKKTYGSRIDVSSKINDDSFHVREVISPSKLLLDNGLQIQLLGIKEIPEKNGEAIEFLEKTIRRNKVFFRNDQNTLNTS